jgi:DNA polymerase-3 subunit gamma/tau
MMNELFARAESVEEAPDQDALLGEMPLGAVQAHYRVLARKYRPTTFAQLIGQDAVVRTLTNAIESGRLPHAWMFTGVRGVGKTTTARIIARALNCTGPDGKGGPTVNPCGVCDSCTMIAEDRHVDVLEMDAASRTGVDDIRDIIEGVKYGPVSARIKIYILDEVHMLSKNAFNALLKTLEEPPPHTKFIFATTEIRKVPVTVLSRCQRFDLRRVDSETLTKHFTDIVALEKVSIEPEAAKLIAHAADGSVRDGLSLLDQAIARGNGVVTAVDVKDMLGLADRGHSMALCRQILRGEMPVALETFNAMQQAGSDPLQILQDMCEFVHLLTKGQVIADFVRDKTLPEFDRQLLTELSDIKVPALARAWQILLKGIGEVQTAAHPAPAAEMVLIRLAYAAELPPPADLIKQLRETVVSGAAKASAPSSPGDPAPRAKIASGGGSVLTPAIATQATPQTEAAPLAAPTNYKELVALFAEKREGALHAQLYSNVHPVRCEPGVLEIRTGANAPANLAAKLGQCLTQWTGQRWMVSVADKGGAPTLAEQDKEAEQKRREKALAHPLAQAALKNFPGARLVSLRQKAAAPVLAATDDGVAEELPPDIEDDT